MRQAYHAESALKAEGLLTELARELDKTHPGAAASLREGMAETLTILRLGVPPTLARTLRSANPIESVIEICREHSKNVKRWSPEDLRVYKEVLDASATELPVLPLRFGAVLASVEPL